MDFTECYADTVSTVAAAARLGYWKTVRRLLQRGFSADCQDNRGWVALHEAAAVGNACCVREILSASGASSRDRRSYVNSLTHEGESAFYLAAERGHLAVVQILLKSHANIDQLTNDASCPLFAAVHGGHKKVVELLLSKGAEVNGKHTASCWTCLHEAVHEGHTDIVRILVNVCDLEAGDDMKRSPLFVAAQYGRRECLEILFNAGARVNAQAADMATPLFIASQWGHKACVDFLLDHGADPNMACSQEWPHLPIHAASEFGHISVLRRLVAVTDRVCDHGEGMVSPMYLAIFMCQPKVVELLLGEGYSPDAQDCTDVLGLHSPLYFALTKNRYRECARLLLAAGARLTVNEWMNALASNEPDMLQLILEQRRFSPPEFHGRDSSQPHCHGKMPFKPQEVRELLQLAPNQLHFAACWLPLLLKAGLEPSLLLQPRILEKAGSVVLNYLLEFVNWSTLSLHLKHILDQRWMEKTWQPHPHFASIPHLSHICRLQIRSMLGPDLLMRTNVVQQLPVPSPLHDFLQFKEIPEPFGRHSQLSSL